MQTVSTCMLPADDAYSFTPQKDNWRQLGLLALLWKLAPTSHFAHTRFDVAVCEVSTKCPVVHTSSPTHSRSEVAVGATSSNCVSLHTVVV